jgi:hypothetical protein
MGPGPWSGVSTGRFVDRGVTQGRGSYACCSTGHAWCSGERLWLRGHVGLPRAGASQPRPLPLWPAPSAGRRLRFAAATQQPAAGGNTLLANAVGSVMSLRSCTGQARTCVSLSAAALSAHHQLQGPNHCRTRCMPLHWRCRRRRPRVPQRHCRGCRFRTAR